MRNRLVVAGGALMAGLLLCAGAEAQSMGTARGKVTDDKGQPLPDTVVSLDYLGGMTQKYETKTNKKGEYTQMARPGNYKITFSKDGYQGTFVETRIGLGDPTYLPDVKLASRVAAQAAAQDKTVAVLQEAFKKATELSQAGKTDEAIAAYNQVLATNPNIPEAHYNIGFLESQRKSWAAAEAAFLKAIEIKPGYPEAFNALSRVYQDSGQPAKAMELMTKAVAANPGDAKVQFNMGIFYLNSGKNEEAQAAFQKAAELDPSNAEVHYHLGTLAVGQNKIQEAIAHLEKYLASNPASAQNKATAEGLLKALKPTK